MSAPADLTATTRLALMADTLIARRADLRDDVACALALLDERFLSSEIVAHLHVAVIIAREVQAVARRSLFDIVNSGVGQ